MFPAAIARRSRLDRRSCKLRLSRLSSSRTDAAVSRRLRWYRQERQGRLATSASGRNADLSPLLLGLMLLDDARALRFQGPAIIFDGVGQLDQLGFRLLPLQAVRPEPAPGAPASAP